jgi:hypothetical protein
LHRHVELVSCPCDAALFGDHPKIVQVLVVEGGSHAAVLKEYGSAIICFYIVIELCTFGTDFSDTPPLRNG